jgi:hypothetical protein
MTQDKKYSIYDYYATDVNLENDGVVVELAPGLEVTIRSTLSEKYLRTFERLRKPYEKLLKNGNKLSQDQNLQIMQKAIAQAILIDWKGVYDREGNEIPFSTENALKILSDPQMMRFLEDIYEAANSKATFEEEEIEEATEALKKSSDGNSNGEKSTPKSKQSSKQESKEDSPAD